ncbi:pleckstrin homology domain-containing family G member 3 [Struthio camelus]|uniref:pleckstrin homology domain-containing family G member 3 n=1 Tax=Struthio camelus TaxID=8801 RepID=UPI003603FB99
MEEAAGDGLEERAGGPGNRNNNNASPASWRAPRGGRPAAPRGARPGYLERVVLEIVESERTYARDLRGIVEGYLGKIIDAEEPLLRPEQVSALFGNIEDIYELSSNLLQNLDGCDHDPVAVAVCFVTRSQEFNIYTQYCNNYPNSVAALSECMRNKQQAKFFRECQEQMRHALPLGAYLLKPVQRILKYHLLLQEIAKHFEHKSGDDYEVVVEAIDTMTCVAWYINDMKRKHEHAIRQQEIQSLLLNWKGPDLTTYGELVLEGTFRVQRVRNERAFFLFDKALLITKRRGDHYVYKNHIPCSSLMLIESTRDSLCFSVAHYKHIKQQYSLQAKSGEEKRVWTHHIKRLILENHHAIIPQKAKEAILEMDLFYPPRLPRYSPERLKKSWSCQPLDETSGEPRQGRRQSEPFQHRDRAETLPDRLHGPTGRRQSEPAKQILQQLGERGEQGPRGHLGVRGGLQGPRGRTEGHPGPAAQLRVPCAKAGSDRWVARVCGRFLGIVTPPPAPLISALLSSMCGRQVSRGRSLLLPEQHAGSDGAFLEAGEPLQHPRAWATAGGVVEEEEEEEEAFGEDHREELPSADGVPASPRDEQAPGHPQVPEGPKACKRPSSPSPGSCEKRRSVDTAGASQEADGEVLGVPAVAAEHPEEPPCSDAEATGTPESPLPGRHERGQPEVVPEPGLDGELPETAEDLRTLSSEEEEEEEEEERALHAPNSILPPSVLDQASVIAERFGSSFSRRSSLAPEEGRAALGGAPPRLPSRSGSLLSLEGSGPDGQSCPPLPASEEGEPGAPRSSAAASPDPAPCPRKESLLSTQDRLLLDKIKSYYDHAEHQDASFSIKRRESLSYIPKGLVRNSVFRIDGPPRPPSECDTSGLGAGARTAVWVLAAGPKAAPAAQPEAAEDFRPPSAGWREAEAPRRDNGLEPLLILEEDDLSAVGEEAAGRSPPREPGADEPPQPPASHPRLLQLAGEAAERPGTKVYQLARQYSLRIKNCRAGARRCLAQLEEDLRLSAAAPRRQPEPPSAGGPKSALAPPSYEQVVIHEQRPAATSPRRFSPSPSSGSPRLPSPGSLASRSPLSPAGAETFAWPDVRELRSKYAAFGAAAASAPRRPPPVNRSRSAPEKVTEAPGRSGRAAAKSGPRAERLNGRSRSAEAGARKHQRNDSDGALRVTAQAALGAAGQRVLVLERVPPAAEPESYVQIRSPTTREKICLKAVAERCKAYQASEAYRRRQAEPAAQPAAWGDLPAAPRHGLVRNLREKFQTLNAAS